MKTSRHVVLAGDSIFDNDGYVPGEPGVLEQLRLSLPAGWMASKVAVDGDVIADVRRQIRNLPADATDLIVSVGGNNALRHSGLVESANSLADLQAAMRRPLAEFRAEYAEMLDLLLPISARLRVCTIYTAIPFDDAKWRSFAPLGIAGFNEIILAEASTRDVPVLRIDLACTDEDDYSALSVIEPSAKGGQKIVDLIASSLASA